MKKIIITLLALLAFVLLGISMLWITDAASVTPPDQLGEINDVSIDIDTGWTVTQNIVSTGISGLKVLKTVFQWAVVIFMVYVGIQMIMYMGNDEEELSKAKRQIWYGVVGILFINIPGSLYRAFNRENYSNISGWVSGQFTENDVGSNIFINFFEFEATLNNIIGSMEVALAGLAILVMTYSGIKMVISRWKEDDVNEGKLRIVWSTLALIFVGFIEMWKYLAFDGQLEDAETLFETAADLALFFAGPIALFFISLAGYYYITSNGDEERVKKAKSIIINTLLAILILLASYTFLLDLANL